MSMLTHGLEMALEGALKRNGCPLPEDERQAWALLAVLAVQMGRRPTSPNGSFEGDVARLLGLHRVDSIMSADCERLRELVNRLNPIPNQANDVQPVDPKGAADTMQDSRLGSGGGTGEDRSAWTRGFLWLELPSQVSARPRTEAEASSAFNHALSQGV